MDCTYFIFSTIHKKQQYTKHIKAHENNCMKSFPMALKQHITYHTGSVHPYRHRCTHTNIDVKRKLVKI